MESVSLVLLESGSARISRFYEKNVADENNLRVTSNVAVNAVQWNVCDSTLLFIALRQ